MKTGLLKNLLRPTLVVLFTMIPLVGNSATFSLAFDDFDDSTLGTSSVVATGSFEFFGSVPDGTYFWEDLSANIDIEFSNGDAFSDQDIVTPLEEILVFVFGGGTQVLFGNEFDFGSGPQGGAIDFENTGNNLEPVLSLEPSSGPVPSSGTLLYFTDTYFGDYGSGPIVPIPAAAWLFGSALLGLGLVKRRKA